MWELIKSFVVGLLIGSMAVFSVIAIGNRCSINAKKIQQIAVKTGVECVTTTNSIFGLEIVKIVK